MQARASGGAFRGRERGSPVRAKSAPRSPMPARPPALRRRGRACGSWDHEALQLGEPRRADAGDGVEILERMERSVRLAVVEDLLSRRRPDAGQGVELLERRRVEVE